VIQIGLSSSKGKYISALREKNTRALNIDILHWLTSVHWVCRGSSAQDSDKFYPKIQSKEYFDDLFKQIYISSTLNNGKIYQILVISYNCMKFT